MTYLPTDTGFPSSSGEIKSVAIIGSGISGASAAWALSKTHDVVLYEADVRPGGHTATVDIDYDGTHIAVDTGFIVYNELNYPNLTALFGELDVETIPTNMTFGFSSLNGRLEWQGNTIGNGLRPFAAPTARTASGLPMACAKSR